MALLSGLFGNNDSESSNSSDLLSVVEGTLGVDASYENYNESVDEDGSSDTSYQSGSFGTDLDFGSVLQSITENFSNSDSDGGSFI